MPTYIYKNLTTGETFEVQQRMVEDALTHHPETGDPVKRLVSAPAIAFKGSGFYATDSRASSGSGKKTDSSSGETSGEAKTEGKLETKPDSSSTASPAPTASAPSSASPTKSD